MFLVLEGIIQSHTLHVSPRCQNSCRN
jgi:hypothetical protein